MKSRVVIKALHQLFVTYGLPDAVVSANGTQFTSEEFQAFLANGLIHHITSAPFHPVTN